jgi:cytochrome c oxidase cbb3-type subunit III
VSFVWRLLLLIGATLTLSQQGSAQLSPFSAAKARALLNDKLPCLGCHAINGRGGRIAADFAGLGRRLPADAVNRIIKDPQSMYPGTIMPKVSLDSTTRSLIVAYLRSLPVTPAVRPMTAPKESSLYGRHCAPCHGAAGKGDGYNAPYLPTKPAVHSDAKAMSLRSDDMLYDAIATGGYTLDKSPRMPPFGNSLTPAQIRELVKHIRQLCKCQGPSWSR